MPYMTATPFWRIIQYTGSNSTEIDNEISTYTTFVINSESGGTLNFTIGGANASVTTGQWIYYSYSGGNSLNSNQYATEWSVIASLAELQATNSNVDAVEADVTTLQSDVSDLQADLTALTSTVSALSASVAGVFVRSMGVAPVPTLLLGGTATVSVQIQPAMPDSSYSAYAGKFAGVSITDLQINSVTVVDMDTVDVAVENVGAGTITGASVIVHAID